MAVFPCDWSQHRYPQPQQSVYLTFANNSEVATTKLRFCPSHFRDASAIIAEAMCVLDDNAAFSSTCDSCGAEREVGVYAKVFASKEPEVQYCGDFCHAHAEALGNDLKVSFGRLLRDP